ncbi:motile sperm domain-containing protein 2-like isoform X2 [Mya arenaria]|nr:motile sperm domain-containing protein 2-like isoform X2 [Mya arenaria]
METSEQNKVISEKASKVRELFLSKHKADIDAGSYDECDVEKFRTNDKYVVSFIRSFETLQETVLHLHESLKFRHDFEVNDTTETSFPQEFWEIGAVYFHNHDKDGNRILYVQVKKYKKDAQMLPMIKQFFGYLMEQQSIKNPGQQIVLLFDMAGAGLSNLDMELIKFIINCFKMYFPDLLAYMLIFEMPWLFSAAWKLIKQMLHAEAVKRIKFVTKVDVLEYIDKDELFEHMGGTDKYEYKYEPEMFDTGGGEPDFPDSAKKKNLNNSSGAGIMKAGRGAGLSQRRGKGDNSFRGRLLTICPAEELEFVIQEDSQEASDTITLKNSLPYNIAFKVKTTSPEKYRVRPSSGYVKPGSETEVVIHLQQGYQNTVHKDKFLVMAMEVAHESTMTFSQLWKSAQKDNIMEHKLRCVVSSGGDEGGTELGAGAGHKGSPVSQVDKKVDVLLEKTMRLERNVQYLVWSQAGMTVILLAIIIYWLMWADTATSSRSPDSQSQHCVNNYQK